MYASLSLREKAKKYCENVQIPEFGKSGKAKKWIRSLCRGKLFVRKDETREQKNLDYVLYFFFRRQKVLEKSA